MEFEFTPIGKEAFVFFVNAKNPIEDITVEQIRKIYAGEITRWEELGVKGMGKIRAFQRSEGSGRPEYAAEAYGRKRAYGSAEGRRS